MDVSVNASLHCEIVELREWRPFIYLFTFAIDNANDVGGDENRQEMYCTGNPDDFQFLPINYTFNCFLLRAVK